MFYIAGPFPRRFPLSEIHRSLQAADIIESFQLLREVVLEQHGICTELDGAQRHPTVDAGESIDTGGPFQHVVEVGRQHFRVGAFGAFEFLARRHFDRRFAGYVGDQKVHGDILAVHVLVHPVLDAAGHRVGVHVAPVLGNEWLDYVYVEGKHSKPNLFYVEIQITLG